MKKLLSILMLLVAIVTGANAAGTTAKVIAEGNQYFSAYAEAKTNLSSNNWVTTSGGPGNSSTSYTAPNGWLDGSGSSKPGYGYMTVQSGKTIIFTVTNITSVSILGCSNNTSDRTINLSVKEGSTEVGTVATKTTSSNSAPEVLTYGSPLDKTKTYTVTVSASSGNNARFMQILFVGAAASTDPSISAEDVDIAATTTGGNIAFTVKNPVEGGAISAKDDAEWLTVGTETTSPISFTATANTGAERSATVTLTYTYNTDKTVTKDVTVTQAAAAVDVVLNGNGGTNGAATITVGGSQLTITTAPVYDEHSLIGYLTAAAGTKVAEANGTLIASVDGYTDGDGKWIGGEGKTLYAQWLTNSDASFTDGQYAIGGSALDLSTLFTSSSDGAVTYTVKSAGDTGAAIDGTSFTATEAGTATVTATQAATATYAGATLDATITVGGTTGANTITYTLDIPDSEDKNKQDINSTNVSSSLFVNSLVGITNNTGGTYGKGSKTDLTVKIPTPATYDANNYMSVGFSVNSGYVFVPSSISVKAQPVTTNKAVKLVLTDGTNSIEKTEENVTAGSIKTVTMSNEDNVSFSGNVTLKIYCYGATDTYRLGSPITVEGAVLPEPKEITLSSTDGKTKGFATFCGAQNFKVSDATAYKAAINEDKIVLSKVGNADAVIPANNGIIIAGEKGATATVTFTTDDATADMSGNSLKGTTVRVATSTLKNSATDKVVGFFKTPSAFKSYTGENFPANLAYFLLTAENAVQSFDIVFEGEATAITNVNADDEANSAAPVKVIKNGKLYIGNYNVAGQLVK